MIESINITKLATKLSALRTTEMCDIACFNEWEEDDDGNNVYSKDAQRIFDNYYDTYYNLILTCKNDRAD